jgi:hypothetical protein
MFHSHLAVFEEGFLQLQVVAAMMAIHQTYPV